MNRGSYVHSLVLTDIASGWTECAPLIVRESTLLVETLDRIRLGLPFPLRALDVDNGGEFLNETMIQYCLRNGIELTRSRPYRKNDQAWIEQKNGSVVRKLLGYRRFEGIAAAQALARLYGAPRLFVNFFQPSFKLAEKHRQGAQVTKRYPPPVRNSSDVGPRFHRKSVQYFMAYRPGISRHVGPPFQGMSVQLVR